jgi:hypothetical protein
MAGRRALFLDWGGTLALTREGTLAQAKRRRTSAAAISPRAMRAWLETMKHPS